MKAAFDMWNVSALSMQPTLTCKMTYELPILFMMIGLHSTQLLVDATLPVIEPELPINCRLVKCSAGYHSICQSNGQPRCKQCSDGFYSSHASQIKECLRCSHCGDNEFEVQPCSPTTNVICQKCRECYSPFRFLMKSCTRRSDTNCWNCSSALGLECEEEKNSEEHSSRREEREKGNNEQTGPEHHAKRKFQVMEIPAGVSAQPLRPSPTKISLSLSFVPTMSVSTSIHSIEPSTRSTLETRKAANPLRQTTKSPTRSFAPFTNPSTKKKETAVYSETKRVGSQFSTAIFVVSVALVVFVTLVSLLLPEEIKRKGYTAQGSRGRFSQLCQVEREKRRPRCPQSRNCCVRESVSSTTARNGDQTDRQATRALSSTETDDSAPNSFQNAVISYNSRDVKSVCEVFPEVQSMWPELLFVTSVHDNFDSTGGTLTHPNSDICINIEPGTFPNGKQQPIFFHVIYNDTYVIRDIPETNERTLISPVIKCGPDEINPQKAMEIVVPHCLYVDEVKKGSIAVYRCEQFTSGGPQNWEKIPSSSGRSLHSKAWFSIKKDSIIIKTKVFSIWSIFVCGVGGSKRKRLTVFASKPSSASNLISLRCYIYSDNEDSKRKVKRLEKEHFAGSRASTEKPFRLYMDNQDINVWLDENELTKRGWMLETPELQVYQYEKAISKGFRYKSACEFLVRPIEDCSTRVEDFTCALYFRQIGHPEDFIYVNPGFSLPTTLEDNGESSKCAQSQCSPGQAEDIVIHPGRLLCQAEHGTQRPRCPQSREVHESVEDQIYRQTKHAFGSTETGDSAPSSFQNAVISCLSEDITAVREVFPEDQSMWQELLFVTSAHGKFDSTGGTLTHPNSDICINIEAGTFPHGKQQPIFFHVIYNDTYVIRDIPETNERTLISPVIKCGPDDINPQKAMEIVVPHCLYVDKVKKGSIAVYRCEQFTNEGPQNWEKIPYASSSGRSRHSKAWFSIKKDSIIIKTKVFCIWSIFVCGVGGSKRKRVTAFASKPNPASNLISLRCYIYSDNEDSKRKVDRFEKEHFPGSKSSMERPLRLYSDNQDINVRLDKNALTNKGWTLDESPDLQILKYEVAYRNGFRCKSACEFAVKPITDCSTRVEDFSCRLYFRQIDHPEDSIYVNPGFSLLPLLTTLKDNGESRNGVQDSSRFVTREDLRSRFDEPVTEQDCFRLCNHIVNDWKMILRHLGVEEAVLDNVDANHPRANEKSYQGLLEWTRLAGTQGATIKNLRNALEALNCKDALEILSRRDDGARLHRHAVLDTTV